MTTLLVVRYVHLLAACVWVGGILVMGPLVLALRRAGADRDVIRAAARMFARSSWTAMLVAVITGVGQVQVMHLPWSYPRLHLKLGAVGVTVLIALVHQVLAGRVSPAGRGILELLVLGSSLVVVAAAVYL